MWQGATPKDPCSGKTAPRLGRRTLLQTPRADLHPEEQPQPGGRNRTEQGGDGTVSSLLRYRLSVHQNSELLVTDT